MVTAEMIIRRAGVMSLYVLQNSTDFPEVRNVSLFPSLSLLTITGGWVVFFSPHQAQYNYWWVIRLNLFSGEPDFTNYVNLDSSSYFSLKLCQFIQFQKDKFKAPKRNFCQHSSQPNVHCSKKLIIHVLTNLKCELETKTSE